MKEQSGTPFAYPAPIVVLGVGEFGLQVLERLGEDWAQLKMSDNDATLANLRLVLARPTEGCEAEANWRRGEGDAAAIAGLVGDGDMPTRAADFCVLRTLGLIRFRDGEYEVGVPRDVGAVRIASKKPGADGKSREQVYRRRFFEWVRLSSDPLEAAEVLYTVRQEAPALDLFLAPLLTRTLHGQSPATLLRCVSRCRAWVEGRDPWPWEHYREFLEPGDGPLLTQAELKQGDQKLEAELLAADPDHPGFCDKAMDGVLPALAGPVPKSVPPLFGSPAGAAGSPPSLGKAPVVKTERATLHVPQHCSLRPSDLGAPVRTHQLLGTDWENMGWAHESAATYGGADFASLPISPFRLGLVDSDHREPRSRVGPDAPQVVERVTERLQALGKAAYKGLVRIWTDMQRMRALGLDDDSPQGGVRSGSREAVRQSLEILGELLVRPLLSQSDREPEKGVRLDAPLYQASRGLSGLSLGPGPKSESSLLADHLVRLGLRASEKKQSAGKPLLEVVEFDRDREGHLNKTQIRSLRRVVNQIARELLKTENLQLHRRKATRRPPRLTVLVVADMGEPFARTATRPILREVHAELLRAFGPILDTFRTGIDRPLTIVPIVWTPHPADPFGEASSTEAANLPANASMTEAAVIIEAIHGLRRWIESIPRGKRCVPHIFVNGRVTDRAVLDKGDSVRQTRDFISLLARNEVEREEITKYALTGGGDADVFSTFSCYQISFQVRRALEFLATKAAEDAIVRILEGDGERSAKEATEHQGELPVFVAGELAQETLREELKDRATALGHPYRGDVSAEEDRRTGMERFSEESLQTLLGQITQLWSDLKRSSGTIDGHVDALRSEASDRLGDAMRKAREAADKEIASAAKESGGGLQLALKNMRARSRHWGQTLGTAESQRREVMSEVADSAVPQPKPKIEASMQAVRSAYENKANSEPMRGGLAAFTVFGVGFGGSLFHFTALWLGLFKHANRPAEFILGMLGWVLGGAAFFVLGRFIQNRLMNQELEKIEAAKVGFTQALSSTTAGKQDGSIFDFFRARLALADALARRSYAMSVARQAEVDERTGDRIRRSIEVQRIKLVRHKEQLGCRLNALGKDDVDDLFASSTGQRVDSLIDPQSLLNYYNDYEDTANAHSKRNDLSGFIGAGGGFEHWRTRACLADTQTLLAKGRDKFSKGIIEEPIVRQVMFRDAVQKNLASFVRRTYPNIGFPAKFKGYEGLDPSGIHIVAEANLVAHPELVAAFKDHADKSENQWTATFRPMHCESLRNSAYMVSMALGIRPQSLHNLRRFESFHERSEMPNDGTFPMSGEKTDFSDRAVTTLEAFRDDSLKLFDTQVRAVPDLLGEAAKEDGGG